MYKRQVNNNAKKIANILFIVFIDTPFVKLLFHYESNAKSIRKLYQRLNLKYIALLQFFNIIELH